MQRPAAFVIMVLGLGLSAGCVERRFVVNSDPPGALVLRNNKPIGFAPADDHYVYYGTYHFTLIKPGYKTLQVDQAVPPPWYEVPPLDLLSEVFWPFNLKDVRYFTYRLEPLPATNPEDILQRGQSLRDRGKTVGTPAPPPLPPPDPNAPPPVPPSDQHAPPPVPTTMPPVNGSQP